MIDAFLEKVEEWVEQSKATIRADVVHEKLVKMGYRGSARSTRRAVNAAKSAWKAGKRRTYRPWIPEPGRWLQFDWGEGPKIAGRRTWLFCAWLSWSRFRVVIPVRDCTLGTLVACLDTTLRRIGGAPTYLLTDNAYTVTIEHIAGIPVRHPQMVAAGRHYGCQVVSCVPYDPESKGGAEATVKIAKADLVPTSANLLPEIVPLLQVVPSKSNEERLLLVGPELASVLATVISRLRNDNVVPLVARYDPHELVTGLPLPHLFQRRVGWKRDVITTNMVYQLLNDTLARTALTDPMGQPLRYTPHDFRRVFATEAVAGGLPVHIAARVLGHASLTTTEAYVAVFQDDLIRSYRAFLDQRRAVRPAEEYREPTDGEWREFQQHFHTRKLELGDCARPYGTPCRHEHSCIRCPMLQVSPRQRARLVEIIRNLVERIEEARLNGWLGEVQGLQVSLTKAKEKLVALDRSMKGNGGNGPTSLGMPGLGGVR